MSEGARLQPGSTFGSLRVERELGMGGFGRVWLARDTRLNRPVALKVLHPYGASPFSAEERARFLNEATPGVRPYVESSRHLEVDE